jgi:hypothetical protein
MMRALMVISFLVAACGGSKSEPAKPATEGSAVAQAGDEHANMPPEIVKFHDVLAPRWHAAKGPERTKSTCDALPDFNAGATGIAKAVPPSGVDPTTWTESAGKLAAALEELDGACKANDPAKFETAFEAVHTSFHGVMEAAGGPHEDHEGDHEGGGTMHHDEHAK